MKNKFYSIKEVATILDIEAYVLRYYEKELDLDIPRNTQGHRIYTATEIEVLQQVKELREQGLELKAIRNILHTLDEEGIESLMHISNMGNKPQKKQVESVIQPIEKKDFEGIIDINDKEDKKVHQFSLMMKDMFKQALVEYNTDTKEQIKEELSEEMDSMVSKKVEEIHMLKNEKDEEYYTKVDQTMREMQKLRKTLAELEQNKEKASVWKKLFKNKNPQIEEQSMHE